MPKMGISMAPNGPGFLAFRHRNFDSDSPAWDLDKRAIVAGTEILTRDDQQQNSIGHWEEDPNTRGDLNCANYWQADYGKRPVGCWAFGYASIIQGPNNNPTGPGGVSGLSPYSGTNPTVTSGPGNTQAQGNFNVMPIGQMGQMDQRFNPKTPIIMQPEGAAQGDPNSPAGAGGNGGNAGGVAGNPGGAGNAGSNDGGITYGPGFQYQDGAIAFTGSSNYDSLSGFNGGYFGGSFSTFNYGGNSSTSALTGLPGVGFGGSFVGFSGVGSYFGGSLGFTLTYPQGSH